MATADHLTLAAEFPTPTRDDWLAAVDAVLKGRDFDRVLVTETLDGLAIQPLYTPAEAPVGQDPAGRPGAPPYTRGASAGRRTAGWDVRSRHVAASATNEHLLDDLEKGATSLAIEVWSTTTVDDLARLLDGVYLDLADVVLEPGPWIGHGLDLVAGLAAISSVPDAERRLGLRADPAAALARHGAVVGGADTAYAALARAVATGPAPAGWLVADATPCADGGASPAVELAASLAAGVAHLRALDGEGVPIDDACRAIEFRYTADADQFLSLAKLRAARLLWNRVAEVCGASPDARGQRQHVVTASAMYSRRDPWVNLLRATTATFAAAVGGADVVTVAPFDSAVGVSDDLARRLARNTQLLLLEESQLAQVVDPAGGSHYVESLTAELARTAWREFQEIEAGGGLLAVLADGTLATRIEQTWHRRRVDLATRRAPLTGISEFPDLDETPVARPEPPRPPEVEGADPALVVPLRRLAEPYEALVEAAASVDPPPTVFLANLGPIATHTARATFARNFFEAVGVRALTNDGFDSPVAAGAAFGDSGARLAVICSSDAVYAERAAATARALVDAGAERVYLAGAPGDARADYEAAGVDEFIHLGADLLDIGARALDTLGVPR